MRQYLSLFKSLSSVRASKIFPLFVQEGEPCGAPLADSLTLQKINRLASDITAIVQRTGEVNECSFSSRNFHGLKKQDFLENGFVEFVHIADRPACLSAFSQAAHSSEQVLVELRLRCHPNSETSEFFIWVELACTALEGVGDTGDGEGQVLCLVRDISRWKERESELLARETVMREQIETRTRLLVNMSRELRTPLNTIIGFSEMMKLPGVTAQNEQQMVEYAGIIFNSGQDLLGVVDEVLDMSQFDAGQYKLDPQIFHISDLVSASVELVQFEATQNDVRFTITGHEDDLQMNADWAACKQALAGLLAAQIKGVSGGQVHLMVKADKGYVSFVVAALRYPGPQEPLAFIAGLQMKKFIDLVSGELDITLDMSDRNEVALRLPQNLFPGQEHLFPDQASLASDKENLCSDKKIGNKQNGKMFALGPGPDERTEEFKKTA